MSVEQNKAIAHRIVEACLNKGDLGVVDALFAADFVNYSPAWGTTLDREETKQSITNVRAAFPDLTTAVDDLIAEGDKVVIRGRSRGTHSHGGQEGTPGLKSGRA